MIELQLKVKHFVKVLNNGEIELTKFMDSVNGCAIERAVVEKFYMPLDTLDEGVEDIRINNGVIDPIRYYHERYDSHDFISDQKKALALKDQPETLIRTIKLLKYAERNST